ncbi:MAG: phosphoribosylanthranilate isomerase [Alphaproteobacteria bacterium]
MADIKVKICGLNEAETMRAAVDAGADMVGLMFYPPSPRAVTPARAAELARLVPAGVRKVGVFVDPGDEQLDETMGAVDLDLLQLHGSEPPARVAEIRQRYRRAIIKAVKVGDDEDLKLADDYAPLCEYLLFDAKPPSDMTDALPGGNGLPFDWTLLAGRGWACGWMLSGGLIPANVARAVQISGAPAVDVSSGVEFRPGAKNPAAIKAFLDAVRRL